MPELVLATSAVKRAHPIPVWPGGVRWRCLPRLANLDGGGGGGAGVEHLARCRAPALAREDLESPS